MALRIKISARAASQVQKAAEWWAENRLAAPGAVGSDFGEGIPAGHPLEVEDYWP